MIYRQRLFAAVSCVAMAGCAVPAFAQSQPAPGQPDAIAASSAGANANNTTANEIVVTGTARAGGIRKQDAPYAITTIGDQMIHDVAPTSAADLVKVVPGMFAETTGGVSGPNIEVRGYPTAGDAPFVTMQLDGLPIYPVATLSFLDNSTQLRLDDTLKRVEATIGGPAVLWGNGQPGSTIDWVEKNGKTDPGGSLRVTVGNDSLYRVDGYYGGQIAEGWYASVGGFYRTDNGIRNNQYPGDRGGQIVGTLTHDIDDGHVTVYGRVTNDKNAFYTAIPLVNTGTATNPTLAAYPGFNPLTATFLGNANRLVNYDVGPGGQSMNVNLGDGRGIDLRVVGMDVDKRFGDRITFTNKMSYEWGTTECACQFTGANPQSLGSFIAGEVASANGNTQVVAANGVAASGSATNVATGQAITGMNTPVIGIGIWYVKKDITAFQDEARLAVHIAPTNTLTFGAYFASYTSHDLWHLGNQQLMTMTANADPIAVSLNNGVQATNADGIYSPSFYSIDNYYNGTNIAGVISDHWDITPKFNVDFGARLEHETVDGSETNNATGFIGTNPNQLYAYGASYLTGTGTPLHFSNDAAAFSIDTDYEIQHNLNAFVSFNRGYVLPTFDDLRSGVTTTTHVDQLQGGIKKFSRLYALYLTAFYNKFSGQPNQQVLANGQIIEYVTSSSTEGLEFQGTLRPLAGVELNFDGDYQHGTYSAGGPGITGSVVVRQPAFQMQFTPSYTLPVASNKFRLYGTVTYIGKRYADFQNEQVLPSYTTLDVGAEFDVSKLVELRFTAENVTNTLAITEGNVRVLGSGLDNNGVFLGRPLFGATYQFSAAVHF